MVVEDGYEFWNDRSLVTVFSAPNYCGGQSFSRARLSPSLTRRLFTEFDNYGACMRYGFYSESSRTVFLPFIRTCSVSEDLLCAFELLKPLDAAVIKKELSKAKRKKYVVPLGLNSGRRD